MMQRSNRATISGLVLIGCIVILAAWVALGGLSPKASGTPQDVAEVAQNLSGQTPSLLPQAEPTEEPRAPEFTPMVTPQEPTAMPTPVPLERALSITSTVVSEIAMDTSTALTVQNSGDSPEPIHYMTWAPTGDKLVYVTNTGKLYWSNLDGTEATLLHAYDSVYDVWGALHQAPMTNTLLVPGYAIHFVPGQKPIIDQAPDTWKASQLNWWSPNRISGVVGPLFDGSEKLVTLDAHGRFIEERNIPYMLSGAVQPGGEWLAYSTDQQSTTTPFYGSAPETVYLLNLNTGQRLQVGESGRGYGVGSWSPDGNWFYMVGNVGGGRHGVVVSAGGREQIIVTPPGGAGDAVWSPDSRRLAFSVRVGGMENGCGSGSMPPCETSSESYVVDLSSRIVSPIENATGISGSADSSMLMRPSWSPDGSLLAFLSFSEVLCTGTGPCSSTTPAFYLLFAR